MLLVLALTVITTESSKSDRKSLTCVLKKTISAVALYNQVSFGLLLLKNCNELSKVYI